MRAVSASACQESVICDPAAARVLLAVNEMIIGAAEVGVRVGVGVSGIDVGVGVWVNVGVGGIGVGVEVGVFVGVWVDVGVAVGVGVWVAVGVSVGRGVLVGVKVGSTISVGRTRCSLRPLSHPTAIRGKISSMKSRKPMVDRFIIFHLPTGH